MTSIHNDFEFKGHTITWNSSDYTQDNSKPHGIEIFNSVENRYLNENEEAAFIRETLNLTSLPKMWFRFDCYMAFLVLEEQGKLNAAQVSLFGKLKTSIDTENNTASTSRTENL